MLEILETIAILEGNSIKCVVFECMNNLVMRSTGTAKNKYEEETYDMLMSKIGRDVVPSLEPIFHLSMPSSETYLNETFMYKICSV